MKNTFKFGLIDPLNSNSNNSGDGGINNGFNSGNFTRGGNFPRKIITIYPIFDHTNFDSTKGFDIKNRKKEVTSFEFSNGKVVKQDDAIFEYEKNLLKRVIWNGNIIEEYSYIDGKLFKGVNNIKKNVFEYTYDNEGRISKFFFTDMGIISTTKEFQYIDDNKIEIISLLSGKVFRKYLYIFDNGNLMKKDIFCYLTKAKDTFEYKYDDKNNWAYNNNLWITRTFNGDLFEYYNKNNVILEITNGHRYEYKYEYNSSNYVIKRTTYDKGNLFGVIEYIY